MQRLAQCRAADVIGNRLRQVETAIAHQLCAQCQIKIVEVGKEISIQSAAFLESFPLIEHGSTTASEHRHGPIELLPIRIEMAQTISAARRKHCVACSVEMIALSGAQQLAGSEAELRILIQGRDQLGDVVGASSTSLFSSRTYRDSVIATARLMEPVVPSFAGSSIRRVLGGSGSGRISPACASFSMTTISQSEAGRVCRWMK